MEIIIIQTGWMNINSISMFKDGNDNIMCNFELCSRNEIRVLKVFPRTSCFIASCRNNCSIKNPMKQYVHFVNINLAATGQTQYLFNYVTIFLYADYLIKLSHKLHT